MSLELLVGQSKIWLFGRKMDDLVIDNYHYKNNGIPNDEDSGETKHTPPQMGENNFLFEQVANSSSAIARIYSFSFENILYDMTRPTLFLVHGKGIDPEGVDFKLVGDRRLYSRMPAETGRTGLSMTSTTFTQGIRAWAYDRGDFTLRLDLEGGTFDTLLLQAELGDWDAVSRSAGSVARSSGSVARASGSVARASGSVARASGSVARAGRGEG